MTLKFMIKLYLISFYEYKKEENLAKELKDYSKSNKIFPIKYKYSYIRRVLVYFIKLFKKETIKRPIKKYNKIFNTITNNKILYLIVNSNPYIRRDLTTFLNNIDDLVEEIYDYIENINSESNSKVNKPKDVTIPEHKVITTSEPKDVKLDYLEFKNKLIPYIRIYINNYYNKFIYKMDELIILPRDIPEPTDIKTNHINEASVIFYVIDQVFKSNDKDLEYIKYKLNNKEAGMAILDILYYKVITLFNSKYNTNIKIPY